MFDSYHTKEGNKTYVDIVQQPNDAADAARLYGEIEDKAKAEVADSVIYKLGAENEVSVVRVDHHHDLLKDDDHTRVVFKINGHTYDVRCKNDHFDIVSKTAQAIVEEVFNDIWKELGRQMIRGLK